MPVSIPPVPARRSPIMHPVLRRLTHWVNVYAVGCMFMSGWGIYNANPILPFQFPGWMTLGGWLGAATIWHFSAMWLLMGNGLIYLLHTIFSGHLRRDLLTVTPRAFTRDLGAALRLKLAHDEWRYNAVQKVMYVGVLLLGVLIVLSGFAIWKPVQLAPLTDFFGGFAWARRVHFIAMSLIGLFVVVHVVMVALVPRTLLSMIMGRPQWRARKSSDVDA